MKVWRLVKTKYAATAFDGEGARLYGARWSSLGVRVAYASDSSALAVLEVLVHLQSSGPLPSYSIVRASIPDFCIEELRLDVLPADWSTYPAPPEVQALGDDWIRSGRSLALRVPSVVAPGAWNLLIHPGHADFARLAVEGNEPFRLDPRLIP